MAFWKPGTIAPGSNVTIENDKENLIIYNPYDNKISINQQKINLPVYKNKIHILYLVEKYQVVIVVGQTGSGKTTQIPQYLYEAGWTSNGKMIACVQPRRVAATTMADRVAKEMGVNLGLEVGYSVRFDEKYDEVLTKIKYMTDGMLFREMMIDPLLSRYNVIMIDEAHERSIYTDLIIGLIKKILKKRNDLKIIIASATLDVETFYNFYNNNRTDDNTKDNVAIISVEGRNFPIDVIYLKEPCDNYINKAIETALKIHIKEEPGDILIFLTGKDEVNEVVQELTDRSYNLNKKMKLLALPIYSGLDTEDQMKVFEKPPPNTRKVVVATNIAEASITINGINYVIDCGFVKIKAFNPSTGMENLMIVSCSKPSVQQRSGRAGRTNAGKVYRLYTEDAFKALQNNTVPEIQRSNLATIILQLKALGIENILRFNFLSSPPAQLVVRALELLYSLNALDDYGRLTDPFGMRLAEFPVEPMLGTMLLNSQKFECGKEILTIAAMISVENIFICPNSAKHEADEEKRKFSVEEGDHITYINVYNAFLENKKSSKWCYKHFLNYHSLLQAVSVRNQLVKYFHRFNLSIKSCDGDIDRLRKCIVTGFFSQAAKLQMDGSYKTVRDDVELHIHPVSVLFKRSPKWVIFNQVVQTTKYYMRNVTVIEPEWLSELAPHFYKIKETKKTNQD